MKKILYSPKQLGKRTKILDMLRCIECDKKLIPDKEAIITNTNKWDEHTFKFSCECLKNKNIKVSVG